MEIKFFEDFDELPMGVAFVATLRTDDDGECICKVERFHKQRFSATICENFALDETELEVELRNLTKFKQLSRVRRLFVADLRECNFRCCRYYKDDQMLRQFNRRMWDDDKDYYDMLE